MKSFYIIICPLCGTSMRSTTSGMVCDEGHGGVQGLNVALNIDTYSSIEKSIENVKERRKRIVEAASSVL